MYPLKGLFIIFYSNMDQRDQASYCYLFYYYILLYVAINKVVTDYLFILFLRVNSFLGSASLTKCKTLPGDVKCMRNTFLLLWVL